MAKYDAFISYSSADRHLVKPVSQLVGIGRRVFWDVADIQPGELWEESLRQALDESKRLVVLWCCHSARSNYVSQEIKHANDSEKPIVPVLLCSYPTVVPLSNYQWIDTAGILKHDCDGHEFSDTPPPRNSAFLSAVRSEFNIDTLTPSKVRNAYIKWQESKRTFWHRTSTRAALSLGIIGVLLLILTGLKPFDSPFRVPTTELVNVATAVTGFGLTLVSIALLTRIRRRIRSVSPESSMLALSLETVFRLSDRGELADVLERGRTTKGMHF